MSSASGESGAFPGTQLRVLRGEPDDAELAALVAGIVAARTAAGEDETVTDPPAPWNDRARRLGRPPAPGPETWRWSLHP